MYIYISKIIYIYIIIIIIIIVIIIVIIIIITICIYLYTYHKHLSYCRYKPTQLTRGTEMQTSLMDCKEWKSPSANVHWPAASQALIAILSPEWWWLSEDIVTIPNGYKPCPNG